jgi:branched-chain amino acid transport system substrate-binding protein
MTRKALLLGTLAAAGLWCTPVLADINIGVVVSATGPAASLGIPEKNTVDLMPTTIAGQKVNYFVLDDATDTTTAVKDIKKLISENKVDAVIGSTTITTLAMREAAVEGETPVVSMGAPALLIDPADAKTKWIFKSTQNDRLMVTAIIQNMKAAGIKTAAFIGFADPYGEGWWAEFQKAAETAGIAIGASERYNRVDQSVTGQIAKIVSTKPDAVLIAGSGTPAALPQSELVKRNYKGRIYQTHGAANPDFLRVGGKDVEGALLPVGPMLVFEQLDPANPVRAVAADYVTKYEAKFGSRSTFGGHAWDAGLLIANAVPEALKKGQPGTVEFRRGLRDALEHTKNLVGTHGVFNMTEQDHSGLDERSRVMVTIHEGKWKVLDAQ